MILAYLFVALFLIIGIYNCRKYLKLKKRSKHFVEVDAVKMETNSHYVGLSETTDGYRYIYIYEYEYDGQRKTYRSLKDLGKNTKILYDKENDKAYDMKSEAVDMSFGRICILFVILVIVALVVRYVDPSSAGGY